MNNEKFWEIINKYKDLDESDKAEKISEDLSLLEDNDIFEFYDTHYDYVNKLYSDNLWKLLADLNGKTISNDGFEDCIGWIIGQGQETTEDVVSNYENISKYVSVASDYNDFENENMLYIFHRAYRIKHNIDDMNEFDKKYIEFMELDNKEF